MAQKSEKEALIDAFYNFDADKDGFISVEDMIVIMMTKGAKMNATEATAFAKEVDFDNDGHINYMEAIEFLLSANDQ